MMKNNKNEKRETVADILAEIRDALRNENPWGENDTRTAWISSGSILAYLDRIEAAWKREREAVEADALAVGGIVEASRHKPGNAAAMREACAKMRDLLMLRGNGKAYCVLSWDEFNESQKMLRAALSAPPRQCDVGTAEEQEKRFYEKFCGQSCFGCPLSGLKRSRKADCIMEWAQMPYEAEEGGAK